MYRFDNRTKLKLFDQLNSIWLYIIGVSKILIRKENFLSIENWTDYYSRIANPAYTRILTSMYPSQKDKKKSHFKTDKTLSTTRMVFIIGKRVHTFKFTSFHPGFPTRFCADWPNSKSALDRSPKSIIQTSAEEKKEIPPLSLLCSASPHITAGLSSLSLSLSFVYYVIV